MYTNAKICVTIFAQQIQAVSSMDVSQLVDAAVAADSKLTKREAKTIIGQILKVMAEAAAENDVAIRGQGQTVIISAKASDRSVAPRGRHKGVAGGQWLAKAKTGERTLGRGYEFVQADDDMAGAYVQIHGYDRRNRRKSKAAAGLSTATAGTAKPHHENTGYHVDLGGAVIKGASVHRDYLVAALGSFGAELFERLDPNNRAGEEVAVLPVREARQSLANVRRPGRGAIVRPQRTSDEVESGGDFLVIALSDLSEAYQASENDIDWVKAFAPTPGLPAAEGELTLREGAPPERLIL